MLFSDEEECFEMITSGLSLPVFATPSADHTHINPSVLKEWDEVVISNECQEALQFHPHICDIVEYMLLLGQQVQEKKTENDGKKEKLH